MVFRHPVVPPAEVEEIDEALERLEVEEPIRVEMRCEISGWWNRCLLWWLLNPGNDTPTLHFFYGFHDLIVFFCARHRQRWEKTMIKLVQIAAFWETILKHFGTTSSQSPAGCSKNAPDCPATLNPCRMFLFESPFLLKSRPMTLRTIKMFICCLVFCGNRGFDDFGRGFRSVDVYNLHNYWHGSGLTAPIWDVWCTRLMWTAVARWIILSYRLNLGGSGLGVCKVYRSLMFDKLRDV